MDMQKRIVLHCGSIESSNLITRCSAASFRAVHWGYLWSKDALVWELQRILKANGNGKQDPTAIQISYIYRTSTRTSLTSSLNTGNLPIGYPCPNFRLAINFADLKASLILWVCLQGLQIIHACFVFDERINRPLEQKSLGVQKHEDFKFSEHPVVMLAAPGQGNRDASADRGEASYHGIPYFTINPKDSKVGGIQVWLLSNSRWLEHFQKGSKFLQSLGLDPADQRLFFLWAEGFEFLSCDLGRCLFSVKDIPKLSSGKGESFLREMKGVPFLGDARSLGSCPTWLHVVGWNQHVSRLPMQCKNPGNRGNSLDSMDLKTAGCIELAELQCALKKQLEYQNLRLRRSKKDIGGLNLGKVGIFMEN